MLTFISSSNQYVSLGSNLGTAQNIPSGTMCAWVRCNSNDVAGAARTIFAISTGTSTAAARALIQHVGPGVPNQARSASRRLDADAASTAAGGSIDTSLHWIVGEFRWTTRQLGVYVDTVVVGSTTIAGWTAKTSNTVSLRAAIGAAPDASTNFFDGDIADVRFYNRFLSDDEKKIIYYSHGRDNLYWGLIERWCLEATALVSGSAVPIYSLVRDGHNGETVNGPVFKSSIISTRRSR